MDTWESFFRGKSARRSRHRSRETLIKGGIIALLIFGIAAWAVLFGVGVPG